MNRPVTQSMEVEEIAAQWVARRDAGLTAREEGEFLAWRAESAAHEDALSKFDALWSAASRPRRTGDARALERRLSRLGRRRTGRRLQAAGAVLALAVAGWFGWHRQLPPAEALPAPVTATLILPQHQLLPDGTRVDYPAGAEFTVDFTGAVRRVRLLRGEAHFAVVKNIDWPFVVEAGGIEFRAVGTAFSVQLGKQTAQLLVTEGRVAVETQGAVVMQNEGGEAQPLDVVEAGCRVLVELAESPRATEVAAVSEREMGERLAWRNPRAEFSGTPLREVVDLLNRQNAVQLVLAEPALADVQLSGVFRLDDVASVVRSLEVGFDIRADRAEGRVVLRRGPAAK